MKFYQGFKSVVYRIAKCLNYVSMALVACMCILMCLDIFGRTLFTHSINGTYEIVENTMLTITAFAFAQAQVNKKNVCVDILVDKLPTKIRDVVGIITSLISLAFFAYCAYSNFIQAGNVAKKGVTSTVLLFPLWPFNAIMGIGITALFLVLVCDVIDLAIDFHNTHGLARAEKKPVAEIGDIEEMD